MYQKGDKIQIISGPHKGKSGVVATVDYILFRYAVDIGGQVVEIKDPECVLLTTTKDFSDGQAQFY